MEKSLLTFPEWEMFFITFFRMTSISLFLRNMSTPSFKAIKRQPRDGNTKSVYLPASM